MAKPTVMTLRVCPFCKVGGVDLENPTKLVWYGRCNNGDCLARGPQKETAQLATEFWNVR